MTLTAHSVMAAAVVSKISNPALGLPLVLLSHFVVDKIPHWDVMTNKNKTKTQIIFGTILDIIWGFLAAILTIFFVSKGGINPIYFFTAVVLSQLPDLYEAPHLIFNWNFPGSKLDYQFQKWVHDVGFDARLRAPWGIVTQIINCALFIYWGLT